jgi:general secretion pathway protein G
MMNKRLNERGLRGASGFTLVEMLMVVVIIGILSGIVVAKFSGRGEQTRRAATRASIAAIGNAIEIYQLDTGRLPVTLNNLFTSSGEPNWSGPYLKGGAASLNDVWATPFSYKAASGNYKVISAGPNRSLEGGSGDDLTN